MRWGHAVRRILAYDPADEWACVRVAGNNCRLILLGSILMRCKSKLSSVQPQARLPPPRIRTMACITVFRQNRLEGVVKGQLFNGFLRSRPQLCFSIPDS